MSSVVTGQANLANTIYVVLETWSFACLYTCHNKASQHRHRNQYVYIYMYSSYLHEQRAQDGKLELNASLVLYRRVFLDDLGQQNQLKSDRQTTLWRWLCFVHCFFFFCVWFVLFIICWYLHVFKQRWTAAIIVENDHFVFEEIWRTTKIDWSMVDFRYEVCQFLGVDFETHQDDVWDASSLLFQMGPNFLEH